jgi:pyruvate formate lyase activating enzyme
MTTPAARRLELELRLNETRTRAMDSSSVHPGRWFHALEDGRLQCDLCPRHCRLRDGQRAFCFVRRRDGDRVVLTTYGRSTGVCIDPVEKKPLNHFLPGSATLSLGTAGCNLGCQFCQNADISKSRDDERLSSPAPAAGLAQTAAEHGCASVSFTYNDPVTWAEYVIDTAAECHARGVRTVAVTAGYITREARAEFFGCIDAANVDLKAFTEDFYEDVCLTPPGGLGVVRDTLAWLKHETRVWFEITTLVIPDHNDSDQEIRELARWVAQDLGPDVPLHFTAFHPAYRMQHVSPTPACTLKRARAIAREAGLHFVYTGNVHDPEGQTTYCPGCRRAVIERDGYTLLAYALDTAGRCACGTAVAGVFGARPRLGSRWRMPVSVR